MLLSDTLIDVRWIYVYAGTTWKNLALFPFGAYEGVVFVQEQKFVENHILVIQQYFL